jgi:hypothetical protein
VLPDPRQHRRDLWKVIAYAARYGSSPPTTMVGRTLSVMELMEFNQAISDILTEENTANRNVTDG